MDAMAHGNFAAGWYGKIPSTGDFIVRRLPAAFHDAWDRWLQASMEGSRERLGAHWLESYRSMPAWRFLLSPGMVTTNAWAGLLTPSVDSVGRYFPLTVACPLPALNLDLPATAQAASPWFDDIEAIVFEILEQRTDALRADAAISARTFQEKWLCRRETAPDATVPFRTARQQMLVASPAHLGARAAQLAEPYAIWLSGESEAFARCALACESLPSAAQFCGMMEGRWLEHGWSGQDLRGAEAA